jgi:hypothetical protein
MLVDFREMQNKITSEKQGKGYMRRKAKTPLQAAGFNNE